MLPDLRFVFGALITLALMGMVAVGLFVSARLSLQAKVGPLEASRTSVFTDSIEWNQFYDPGSVRRFVGLARQGEARESPDLPPEDRAEVQAGAPAAVPAASEPPVPDQHDDPDPAAATPTVADATDEADTPAEGARTVAAPALPEPTRESPVPERAAVRGPDTAPDLNPLDEMVVAHAPSISALRAPSQAEEPQPAAIPFAEARLDRAAAVTVETENGWDQEPWDMTSALDDGNETSARANDARIPTSPSPAIETALPSPPSQSPAVASPVAATPPPAAALAKAALPMPAKRSTTPVTRSQPAGDDDAQRPRVSPPRSRALAARPRSPSQAPGPQPNVQPQPPPGQPVFGPYFPYATPQPGSVQFGPNAGQRPPAQAGRQQSTTRARAPQYPAQPAYDPRPLAPQPSPQTAPRQPNYGQSFGWR